MGTTTFDFCGTTGTITTTPKQSVRIVGQVRHYRNNETNQPDNDVTFRIGDIASYDSYNLVYYGKIVAIGEKTVTIQEDDGRKHMLKLADFALKNINFNLERAQARNHDTLMYI
jgi:hypothetical protein